MTVKNLLLIAALAAAALLHLALPSLAQSLRCLPREALVERLEGQFSETPTGAGLQSPQQVLEIWTSAETGTWTVFFTRPSGLSCIVATGQHWQEFGAGPGEPQL